MRKHPHTQLSRRERQIMDIIYRHGRATAAEVMADLPNPPSYSAVRALLRILEEKGHLRHEQEGPRYVYHPTVSRERAKRSALKHVLSTFFKGSVTQAVAALIDLSEDELTDEDLERIADIIRQAKENGG